MLDFNILTHQATALFNFILPKEHGSFCTKRGEANTYVILFVMVLTQWWENQVKSDSSLHENES